MNSSLLTPIIAIAAIGLLGIPVIAFSVGMVFVPSSAYLLPWPYWTILWGVAGVGLTVCYLLRFKQKQELQTIDFLKLAAVVIFVAHPTVLFFDIHPNAIEPLLYCVYLVVALIYLYDRMILSTIPTRGVLVAVLISQSIIIFIFLVYALVQRTQAIKSQEMAIVATREAQEAEMRAEQARALAEHTQHLLAECRANN